jgi:hypothetical protein
MDAKSCRGNVSGGILGHGWIRTLAMCALVGIDPVGVINAGPEDRELLVEVAAAAHKIVADANKKRGNRA